MRTLDEIKINPRVVRYGAAMEHAETTELGIWGQRSMLESDCAKIMLAEVRKFAIEVRAKPREEAPNPIAVPGQARRRLDLEERIEMTEKQMYQIRMRIECIDAHTVRNTNAFQLAYAKARSVPENQLADVLDQIGVKDHHMHVRLSKEEQEYNYLNLHISIIREIIGWPEDVQISLR